MCPVVSMMDLMVTAAKLVQVPVVSEFHLAKRYQAETCSFSEHFSAIFVFIPFFPNYCKGRMSVKMEHS